MSLFGAAPGRAAAPAHLVSFRAGKMTMEGKLVKPDTRKGQIYLQQADDSLMHFCWKDRTSGTVEEDLIIFPDEVEFKRVAQCTTGRVFLLKFLSSSRKMFFWMQEPKDNKDAEYCKKINRYLNNPPVPGQPLGDDDDDDDDEDAFGAALQGGADQSDLMAMFSGGGMGAALAAAAAAEESAAGGANGAGTAAAAAGAAGSQQARQAAALADLQNIVQGLTGPPTAGGAAGGSGSGAAAAAAGVQPPPNLSDIVTAEALGSTIENAELREQLMPLLPECTERSPEALRNILTSAQFAQALGAFQSGLQSGQLGPLLAQFGLDPSAGYQGVDSLLSAVEEQSRQASAGSERKSGGGGGGGDSEKKSDDKDAMDTS